MTCSICHDDSRSHNKRSCQFRPGGGKMNYTPEERQKLLKAQAIQRQEYKDYLIRLSAPEASRLPPLPEGWGAVEEQPEFLVAQ